MLITSNVVRLHAMCGTAHCLVVTFRNMLQVTQTPTAATAHLPSSNIRDRIRHKARLQRRQLQAARWLFHSHVGRVLSAMHDR